MKKQLFSLLAVAAIAVTLASCGKKEDPAKDLVVGGGSANIYGFVTYQPDAKQIAIPDATAKVADLIEVYRVNNAYVPANTSETRVGVDVTYEQTTAKYSFSVTAAQDVATTYKIRFYNFTGTGKVAGVDKPGLYKVAADVTVVVWKDGVYNAGSSNYAFAPDYTLP